jgi:dihydrofolate reductase
MRKVTFGGASSLDNYFAGKDDAMDWLLWSDEVGAISGNYFKTVDTMVMGRRTYEVAARVGSPAYRGVKTYVCSRTLKPPLKGDVELVSSDAVAFVSDLKSKPGKGICIMGGGCLPRLA